MYPDSEFLPRAPDPEEILATAENDGNMIEDGDGDQTKGEGGVE
jgi:hypothetical protein